MDNGTAAEILLNIATLLELKGENPFKTRAYSNVARTIEMLPEPLDKIVAEGRLGEIAGIGEALQKKIHELVTTGKLAYHEQLKASTPPGLLLMLDIPGLGPKKVKALHDELGVETIEALDQACKSGKVASLKGFGSKSQANILDGIERRRSYASKCLLHDALSMSEEFIEALRAHDAVIRCSVAGSVRRSKEVIGDIDLLASSKNPEAVLDFFCSLQGIQTVIAKGPTKASVIIETGMQADLRVVSDAEFPAALMYFTGSKEHNIVMRQRAITRGLRLNEYGLFQSEVETRDPSLKVPAETEHDIFQALGLHFIPPEMREDAGEFALAEKTPVPRLIEWTDLKGSIHNHSTWSDGRQTPEQIARSMAALGLSYWGVTDHSQSSFQANGLNPARLRRQLEEIAALNRKLEDEGINFRLLTGIEVDILKDGRLDCADELLAELDVVIASIHQSFNLPEEQNTARLVAAAQNPCVHILGHPTGRLLLAREGYKINHDAVIDACAQTGTWIELNSSPSRLDMDWRYWPLAKRRGVKCVINCDAHRLEDAGFLRLGAAIARKAGLTREDVANTMPLKSLREALQTKKRLTML